MTRIFAGTVVSPEIAQPFHRTIWPERSGTISRKPLQHSHFDAVPCGTLNPSRQYLKLSLRGRSVPPRLLGVESGTMRADLRPCKPRGCGSVEGSQARGERGRNEVSRAHETDRETFRAGWLAGPGVTLDSSEASTRCLTAWARSNEPTGFPATPRTARSRCRPCCVGYMHTDRGHPILYTGIQTRLKVLGFVPSTDRQAGKTTVQSHGRRAFTPAVTETLVHGGRALSRGIPTAMRGPAREGVAGALFPKARPGRDGGQNRSIDPAFQPPTRIISLRCLEAEKKNSPKQFQKNPPRRRIRGKLIAAGNLDPMLSQN
jgi:hypothetical protein